MTALAADIAAVPAQLDTPAARGWLAAIRLHALGLEPGSDARRAFLAEAERQVRYGAFLSRGALAKLLTSEAAKLPPLLDTVAD